MLLIEAARQVEFHQQTQTVVLQPASILHGGLAVNTVTEFQMPPPDAFSNGTTQVVPQTAVEAKDKPVNRIDLKGWIDSRRPRA